MSKDSYWFKHDSNSGRGERLRRIQFIYTHWGKGIYWDVIEYLRDQDNYKSTKDDLSLRIICDIIGCKDEVKFMNWFKDCIKINLLQCDETHFWSDVLVENMAKWEAKKLNGSQGGRGNKKANQKLIESESKANQKLIESESKANQKLIESIIEDKIIEDNSIYGGVPPNDFLFPLEALTPLKKEKLAMGVEFSEFWSTYPKKKSKGDAEKAWLKIKPELYQTIINATKAFKDSWNGKDMQYCPYPASWLNAKGWEDEKPEEKAETLEERKKRKEAEFLSRL